MIIEGQIHGGLHEGFAVAMGQELPFSEDGDILGDRFMYYSIATTVEPPYRETGYTVTPSPQQPRGAKVVARSLHVGSTPPGISRQIEFTHHIRSRQRRPGYRRAGFAGAAVGGSTPALPHIDVFAPAHNLQSLLALEPMLTSL